jgi:hypothetical protein
MAEGVLLAHHDGRHLGTINVSQRLGASAQEELTGI